MECLSDFLKTSPNLNERILLGMGSPFGNELCFLQNSDQLVDVPLKWVSKQAL